jgi:hypothetical protein
VLHGAVEEFAAEDLGSWTAKENRIAELDGFYRAVHDATVENVFDDFEVGQLRHDVFLLGSAFKASDSSW